MVQTYASPPAFKQALEQRLKSSSSSGVDFARRRQLLVFDRFLARIVAIFGTAALLKAHKRQLTTSCMALWGCYDYHYRTRRLDRRLRAPTDWSIPPNSKDCDE